MRFDCSAMWFVLSVLAVVSAVTVVAAVFDVTVEVGATGVFVDLSEKR